MLDREWHLWRCRRCGGETFGDPDDLLHTLRCPGRRDPDAYVERHVLVVRDALPRDASAAERFADDLLG